MATATCERCLDMGRIMVLRSDMLMDGDTEAGRTLVALWLPCPDDCPASRISQ